MSDSQKFLSRNRAPRVQIEYDVELYGAEKKVQLPFVMGVLSDLSGKAETPDVADRSFLEIDVDNFDDRMAAMAPKAQFTVPNTLAGEGNLAIDLTFQKMSDFSPEAIAANVDALRPLLEARQHLSDLMAYMDGKAGAEALIESILTQPDLLEALANRATDGPDMDAALKSLLADMPEASVSDDTDQALASLAANAPTEVAADPSVADVLGSVVAVPEAQASDNGQGILDSLKSATPATEEASDATAEVLSSIVRTDEVPTADQTDDILSGITAAPLDGGHDTSVADVLDGIAPVVETAEADDAPDVLDALRDLPTIDDVTDLTDDILGGIATVETEAAEDPALDDVLSGIDADVPEEEGRDDSEGILASLKEVAPAEAAAEESGMDDILSGIDTDALADIAETDDLGDVLASIETVADSAKSDQGLDDILSTIDIDQPTDAPPDTAADTLANLKDLTPDDGKEDGDDLDKILGSLEPAAEESVSEQDLSEILAGVEPDHQEVVGVGDGDDLRDILGSLEPAALETETEVGLDDILSGIDNDESEVAPEADDLDAILGDLEPAALDMEASDQVSDILATVDTDKPEADTEDLDDILGALEPAALGADETEKGEADNDLDALLAGLDAPETEGAATENARPELDALSADLDETDDDDLDALMADLIAPDVGGDGDTAVAESSEDLDAHLAGLDDDKDDDEDSDDGDLDALLADLEAPDADEDGTEAEAANDDLDAMLAGFDGDDNESKDSEDELDTLMSEIDDQPAAPIPAPAPAQSPFGVITAPRPARDALNRHNFRMAVFGDFSGRAARGVREIGPALAARRPINLDVDTVEDVIAGFATSLTLPIGKDGAGIDVKLGELDDLHPDELYDNVPIFDALSGLRQQLGVGSMADKARARLKEWSEAFGTPVRLPKSSASTSVPANLKLSDFQALIGDTTGATKPATPIDDIIARIVGPHIVKAPDANAQDMIAAVDEALSSAMRLILHHPDFQALESQWRSLDLLARRIETDSTLEIILYDVSAEELAADLAADEDLSQSGLFGLLTDALDGETGAGGFSALFGLYTFEETPPHAEVLARIGQVAAHVDAPFFAAMTPGYLETPKEDRHPLVAKAWDTLRSLPEAGYLGLASPRFMLRQPYGAKSDPVSAFEFEEFTAQEGLSGMLWANPVVLVAILLAGTHRKDGKAMDLGSLMSLGDIPYHFVTDRHGDQVALPCTERNLTSDPAQQTLARGYMPVVWIKGRNEIRLGSFRSLSGDEIAGPWSGQVPPRSPAPEPVADLVIDLAAGGDEPVADLTDDLDIDLDLDDGDTDDDTSLDDLLAGFDDDNDDDDDDDDDDDEMDPELAALLEGL